MNVQTKNFWLEISRRRSHHAVVLQSGHLTLRNAIGSMGIPDYSGNVDIDLGADQITCSQNSFIDLRDLKSLLTRRLPIPVRFRHGSGQIKAWGPQY